MALRYQQRIRVRALTGKLVAVAGVLVALHVVVMLWRYQGGLARADWWHTDVFDLDEEASFGTWFSVILLFLAGRFLLLQARAMKEAGEPFSRSWFWLGVGFLVLSVDELVGIHEYVNTAVESTRWTTFGAIAAGIAFVCYLPFLKRLPARTRHLFIAAGALYLGGTLMLERATDWYETAGKLETLPYNLLTALEEAMEMAGVILFLHALLGHMARAGGAEDGAAVDVETRAS